MRVCLAIGVILHVLCVCFAGFCLAAPFMAKFEWSQLGTTLPTWQSGLLIADKGDDTFKFHMQWCDAEHLSNSAEAKSECDEAVIVQLAASIILFIAFLGYIVAAVLCFFKPRAAFVVSPIAFTLAAAALFIYCMRYLPQMRVALQQTSTTSTASWSYNWGAYVYFVFIVVAFITALWVIVGSRRMVRERQARPEAAAVGAAPQPANNEGGDTGPDAYTNGPNNFPGYNGHGGYDNGAPHTGQEYSPQHGDGAGGYRSQHHKSHPDPYSNPRSARYETSTGHPRYNDDYQHQTQLHGNHNDGYNHGPQSRRTFQTNDNYRGPSHGSSTGSYDGRDSPRIYAGNRY